MKVKEIISASHLKIAEWEVIAQHSHTSCKNNVYQIYTILSPLNTLQCDIICKDGGFLAIQKGTVKEIKFPGWELVQTAPN